MPSYQHGRPTLGVLAGYQLYEGMPHSFLEPLFRGIYAAACERECNLLLACGMGRAFSVSDNLYPSHHPAWPLLAPDNDFVPVGQWNTDGLIIVKPIISEARAHYIQQLLADQHPLVFIGAGEYTPAVGVDNEGGIRQALEHLCVHHHHRQIAFIAGNNREASDSEPRLKAYLAAVQAYGLAADKRLMAYGWHTLQGGYRAMQTILNSGATFTAVLASNDESALGAMQALREAGRRIPQEVAVVGFDDRVEAKTQSPLLTTVHYPVFETGQQAVSLLLKRLAGQTDKAEVVYVPTRLVIRESCGCQSASMNLNPPAPAEASNGRETIKAQVAQALSEAVFAEVQQLSPLEVNGLCQRLVEAFAFSLAEVNAAPFASAWEEILRQVEAVDDDPQAWQAAIVILRDRWRLFVEAETPEASQPVEAMFLHALMLLGKSLQRRYSRSVVRQEEISNQVGLVTAQLLTALDEAQILTSLTKRLPSIGIRSLHVVFFKPQDDDPVAESLIPVLSSAEAPEARHYVFPTHQFPPPGLYSPETPFQLALLPLVFQDERQGYVAFDAANLIPCAAIARQLAAAFQSAHLYREAARGKQLAEKANQLKSRFLSMVSHELRTPLNLIVGLSEMLLRETPATEPVVPDQQRHDLELIHSTTQHLSGLIRDVLDLASSEAGELKLVPEPLDLREMLQPVLVTGEQLARDKGLAWQVRIPDSVPRLWGDRTRLRQVALNLVSNAIKFTKEGTITLEVKRMKDEVGSMKEGESGSSSFILHPSREAFILISVSDTGLGIPPSEQDLIFDEFRQSERTTARGYGGLGLGLAICKRLVELHGGHIGVQSSGAEGAGSTFYFTLPLMGNETPPASGSFTSRTVLVLSERPGQGKYLGEHLRQQGFEVVEYPVAGTRDWLPQLLTSPPGAVVLDPGLASEQGWEVLKVLKGNPATRDIPILFYSLTQEHDAGFMLEMDYLTKPVGATDLAQALARQGWSAGENAKENAEAKTILVVDDDPGILETHARMVQHHSEAYRVLKARNGREALALLQQTLPDLVLLDLMMPELDGFGVLEAMREREATRDIPVIVLTAQVLREADMARLNRGVATVLNKGLFSVQETLAHIETALARSRQLGSKAQRLVRKAMAYLHEHSAEPLARETIADALGVSPGYLDLCFRQEMNLTPMTYLNRYRVNQAKTLLTSSELSLTEIALAVGFADSAHFSHAFRREVGQSPSAYRRGH